jgi:hypothetical protein
MQISITGGKKRVKSIFDNPTLASLVLTIEHQNQVFLTIQLSKPFKFGHRAVLMGGFNFLFTI